MSFKLVDGAFCVSSGKGKDLEPSQCTTCTPSTPLGVASRASSAKKLCRTVPCSCALDPSATMVAVTSAGWHLDVRAGPHSWKGSHQLLFLFPKTATQSFQYQTGARCFTSA